MRIIRLVVWVLLTLICLAGDIAIWLGSKVGGILIPLFAILIILAVIVKNCTAVFVFACALALILIFLFSIAMITGKIKSFRNELI